MAKAAKEKKEEKKEKKVVGAHGAEPVRKTPIWGVVVLVLQLVIMLMVFNPGAHNGGDTAGYLTLAHSMLERHTYQDLWQPGQPPHTKYPPVFPAILAIAIALGARTWFALKVVPALFTTISVMAAYLWAKQRRGEGFGAAVALLTAGSNAVLWASHWELSDPPFIAFTFIALWAYDRIASDASAGADRPQPSDAIRWLAIGGGATALAYFTREAGLPLLLAATIWLMLRKRWRAALATGGAIGLLALLWSLRANEGAQYMSEFWMIDPYQPDLGRVSFPGLILRVLENTKGYATRYVPVGFTGLGAGPLAALIGIAIFALGAWGWVKRLRRPAVTELFVPMYLGLILLWPQVWSGDRFALPLFPILLFYAAEVILDAGKTLGREARFALVALPILVIAIPASASWQREWRASTGCATLVESAGPFACWGQRTHEFVQASLWSGAHLPEGSIVLSRKPRIFYVESGLASETFPFTKDADRFLAFADSVKARYVVVDYMDDAASVYVVAALVEKGGAFCAIQGFGPPDRPQTILLGILPPDQRIDAQVEQENGEVSLAMSNCPRDLTRATSLTELSAQDARIPLLVGFR